MRTHYFSLVSLAHRPVRTLVVVVGAAALLMIALTPAWPADDVASSSERITFTKDVLPIVQENCQTCHRPSAAGLSGMIAPMSLMNYREVRPWAKAIAKAVEGRIMPPWHATDHTAGLFRNERMLRVFILYFTLTIPPYLSNLF